MYIFLNMYTCIYEYLCINSLNPKPQTLMQVKNAVLPTDTNHLYVKQVTRHHTPYTIHHTLGVSYDFSLQHQDSSHFNVKQNLSPFMNTSVGQFLPLAGTNAGDRIDTPSIRCRVNSAHKRQSRPDSDLDLSHFSDKSPQTRISCSLCLLRVGVSLFS